MLHCCGPGSYYGYYRYWSPRRFGCNAAVEQPQLPGLEPVLGHGDDLLDEHDVADDDFADDVPMKRPLADIDVDERIHGLKRASLPHGDQ